MIRVIFFDFDGIILESVNIKTEAFAELFSNFPEHVEQIIDHHMNHSGVSRFDKIKFYFKEILKRPLSEALYKEYLDRFGEITLRRVLQADFVPGAEEFIKANHSRFDFYIVSATPTDEIRKIVQGRGLTGYFIEVYGSPTKKGEWVKKILRAKGYNPQECVFIGDALSDYKASADNGISFIGRLSDKKINPFKDLDLNIILPDLTGFEAGLERL